MPSALAALAGVLRDEGGLVADALTDPLPAPTEPDLAARVAAGPRPSASGHAAEYALLVEAIHEGYLLHYAQGRVLAPEDPDLALLAGDRLYALGLARLAELGDLAAVIELADAISMCAQAHAENDPERASAVWEATADAVGGRPADDLAARKAGWRGAR